MQNSRASAKKKSVVSNYFEEINRLSQEIKREKKMLHFFSSLKDNAAETMLEYELDEYYVNPEDSDVNVIWNQHGLLAYENSRDVEDLGAIVKHIIDYD